MSEQQNAEATETEAPATTTEQQTPNEPIRLPDDHPLVTAYQRQKELNRELAGKDQTAEQRIAALEKRAGEAERQALVSGIQAKHGISDDDAALFLTGSDAETLEKQATRLAARSDEQRKNGNHVPTEGKSPTTINGSSPESDEKAAVRGLFGSGDD